MKDFYFGLTYMIDMKKISDWYKELPTPQKEMALDNLDISFAGVLTTSLSSALSEGFVWADANEGYDYWAIFVKGIEADEFRESRREDFQWEADNLPDFED